MVKPGTTIDLINSAQIISFGAINLLGSAEAPVLVTSSDSTGQGIAVIDAADRSKVSHSQFSNLTVSHLSKTRFTGPLVFYQSDFDLVSSEISKIFAEDALNSIRSDFVIRKVKFGETTSDAFDADFSNGIIEQTSFVGVGNDGVDLSGSNVVARHLEFHKVGDKALSIGEASRASLNDIEIKTAEIGIAVKDGSHVKGDGIVNIENQVDIAVFQKKREYDYAMAVLTNVEGNNTLLEQGSRLLLNGAEQPINSQNLRSQIYVD